MLWFIICFEVIGTLSFAVSGAMTGLKKEMDIFGTCALGVVTAVGGGVLRDVLAGDRPYIFVKHVYACASLLGAIVCVLMWPFAGQDISMIAGFVIILATRLCAARFRWSLPKARVLD